MLAVLTAVLVGVIAVLFWAQQSLGGQIDRLPDALPSGSDRPAASASGATNILFLGSDKRADGSIAGQRSDTMMLVHIDADRQGATIVSIPRDSWVEIPGHGRGKINAAFAYGGTALAVETIEDLTGLRIDHVAAIDFEGFQALTDALGGVTITIPETVTDGYSGRVWEAGTHHMDGETALAYVRQRAGLPGGDLDRVKRQQNLMRTLFEDLLSRDTLSSPTTLYRSLDAITSNLAVDEDWSTAQMRNLALSMRSVRGDDIIFTTVPVKGTGMEGAQSVVYLDEAAAQELWTALAEDRGAQWVRDNDAALGDEVS